MDGVIDFSGAERAFIVLVDERGRIRIPIARDRDREAIAAPEHQISRRIVDEVLRRRTSLRFDNAMTEESLLSAASVVNLELRSVMCAPLLVGDARVRAALRRQPLEDRPLRRRGPRPAGHLRGPGRDRPRERAARPRVRPGREAQGDGQPDRRRRPRLQQPALGDPRAASRICSRGPSIRRSRRGCGRSRRRRRTAPSSCAGCRTSPGCAARRGSRTSRSRRSSTTSSSSRGAGGRARCSGPGGRIDVVRDVPHGLFVKGNGAELREVFTNIVLNAVAAMPDGGNALARRDRDAAARDRSSSATRASGMSEEVRENIFDPYFTTRGQGGHGPRDEHRVRHRRAPSGIDPGREPARRGHADLRRAAAGRRDRAEGSGLTEGCARRTRSGASS